MYKKKRAFRGFLFSLGSALTALLSVVLVARLLGPRDSGVAITAMTIFATVQLFADVGLSPALVQKLRIRKSHITVSFWVAIGLGLAATVACYVSSADIAGFFNSPDLDLLLILGAPVFLVRAYSSTFEALMQRRCAFSRIALADIAGVVVGGLGVSTVLAYYGFGPASLVFGLLIQNLVRAMTLRAGVRIAITGWPPLQALRDLAGFGVLFSAARLLNHVATQADTLIISKLLGPLAAGLYARSFQVLVAPANLMGQALSNVSFPMLSKIQNDRSRVLQLHEVMISWLWFMACPLAAHFYFFSQEFVAILFGSDWSEMAGLVSVLGVIMPFRIAYKSFDPVYKSLALMKPRVGLQALYAICVVCGALVGSFIGLTETVWLVSLAVVIHFALSWVVLARASDHYPALRLLVGMLLFYALCMGFQFLLSVSISSVELYLRYFASLIMLSVFFSLIWIGRSYIFSTIRN